MKTLYEIKYYDVDNDSIMRVREAGFTQQEVINNFYDLYDDCDALEIKEVR